MNLLTPAEYAKKKNINKATVYRWIENGNIETVYVKREVPMIEENSTPLRMNVKSDSKDALAS